MKTRSFTISLRGGKNNLVEKSKLRLETFKTPKTTDVVIYRKDDILKCIDDNIIDKETAYAIVKQCEIDATDFIRKGKWAGIPFIGNIRIPKITQLRESEEVKALEAEAAKELDVKKYVMFRRNLNHNLNEKVKNERYYNYLLSTLVTKHYNIFKYYLETKGEFYAKAFLMTIQSFDIIDGDYDWQQANNR